MTFDQWIKTAAGIEASRRGPEGFARTAFGAGVDIATGDLTVAARRAMDSALEHIEAEISTWEKLPGGGHCARLLRKRLVKVRRLFASIAS